MADGAHLAVLGCDACAWNAWRDSQVFLKPDLRGADLLGRDLSGFDLHDADLSQCDLRRAKLVGANLTGASLRKADLTEAILQDAKLAGADLSDSTLNLADLRSSDLSGADLRAGRASQTCFDECQLVSADLRGIKLSAASLRGACLKRANLCGATLRGTALERADFDSAVFGWTVLGDLDVRPARGLHLAQHEGPSTVGVDTAYRSNGQIPEAFLRGCGVPHSFVDFANALGSKPAPAPSCFISYSSTDQGLASQLYRDLQENGVRCWYAPESLRIGDRFESRIQEAIRECDRLLLIVSEKSLSSDWVAAEVDAALERESREPGRLILLPIRVDDSILEADQRWAATVRQSRHIGEFRDWRSHDSYQRALQRLLRDLKGGSELAAGQIARSPDEEHLDLSDALKSLLASWLNEKRALLFAIARAVDGLEHCTRVSYFALLLGESIGQPLAQLQALHDGAFLHDVGKVIIPPQILFRQGPLDDTEFKLLQTHTVEGERLCRQVAELEQSLPVIRSHHEAWNGTGYPDGLRGPNAPLAARIVQLADLYDALTSSKPYKPGFRHSDALALIRQEAERGRCEPKLAEQFAALPASAFQECMEAPVDPYAELVTRLGIIV